MSASFYTKNSRFYVAVDCIIFGFEKNNLRVLVQRRAIEPFRGELSLMGGFVRDGENVDDAARRVLLERTGLENVYLEQVGAFGDVTRDKGARVISVCYYSLVNRNQCNDELNKKYNGFWANLDSLPQLIFDHEQMLNKALTQLRHKISFSPVGFNLLPELFTLSQLQSLYEAILGEEIDKRNFRKRVNEMPFIEKTDNIDKTGSKRGAYQYKFNRETYNQNNNNFKL